jgi:hypothetical protein
LNEAPKDEIEIVAASPQKNDTTEKKTSRRAIRCAKKLSQGQKSH